MAQLLYPKKRREAWALIGNVTVIRETPKAVLVRVPQAMWERHVTAEHWIPKSMLNHDDNEIRKMGDQGFMVIPEWLAKEKKLL